MEKDDLLAKHADLADIPGLTTVVHDFMVSTADGDSDGDEQALADLLRKVREILDLDVAFVSEFIDGKRVFKTVDSKVFQSSVVKGGSDSLEETYCQRIVDGRMPLLIPNTAYDSEAVKLRVTDTLNIRAYLSAPVVLSTGEVYGTVCCIGNTPSPHLSHKEVAALRFVAEMVAQHVERGSRQNRAPRE